MGKGAKNRATARKTVKQKRRRKNGRTAWGSSRLSPLSERLEQAILFPVLYDNLTAISCIHQNIGIETPFSRNWLGTF